MGRTVTEHLSVHERKVAILHNRADMVHKYAVIFNNFLSMQMAVP